MNHPLEYAKCPQGHPTPIRPSLPALQEGDQQWTAKDDPFVVIACVVCKRVYKFETQRLEPGPSLYGLTPFHPGAPLHLFEVELGCDDPSCDTPLIALAVRKRDTSPHQIEEEKGFWRWAEQRSQCPSKHDVSLPPYE
jgi:hypothetical protein